MKFSVFTASTPDWTPEEAVTAALGAGQVRVSTLPLGTASWGNEGPSGIPHPVIFEAARSDFEWVAERAAHDGVKALVELHHRTVTASASSDRSLLEGLDPQHVGVLHDSVNLLIAGQADYLPAFELLGEYLAHIHGENAVRIRRDEADASGAAVFRNEWVALHSGQGSVLEYFRALAAYGYDGWVTVEDFSTELPLEERTAVNLDNLRRTAAHAGLTAGAGAR